MAISAHTYGKTVQNWMKGSLSIDWDGDTFKAAHVKAAYTPNVDSDEFWSTPVTNELASGSGYTTGGATLGSLAVNIVTASNLVEWDAADAVWTFTSAVEFQYTVIYKSTGTSSTSPLIAFIDWGETLKINGEWTAVWNAAGLVEIEYG